ncbi:MAG: hypothetical protein JSV12_09055 [Candidatus Bathyarchaeota archaeon]|nr:MAG: hypothetical protein JSV12_09055 [Candidatus Bathyarchaeota archaeon]
MGKLVTEVRSFYSLKELSERLEEKIDSYKTVVEEYNQRLGSLLREMEATHGKEEWSKEISSLQKSSKGGKNKGKKKEDSSSGWVEFKDIILSTEQKGEAHILFEATEEINSKITQLTKIRDTVEDLKKLGLGEDILYITYLHDEVPEKIVLRKKNGKEAREKFEFMATLYASKSL